jgi:hypothetical protein
MHQDVPCLFGDGPAVAVYELDRGCWCHPELRRMALCPQHSVQAHLLGTMELVEDLTVGQEWTKVWKGER